MPHVPDEVKFPDGTVAVEIAKDGPVSNNPHKTKSPQPPEEVESFLEMYGFNVCFTVDSDRS
jgi:hypothetical protein